MERPGTGHAADASSIAADDACSRRIISRRQVLGRMSVAATAGAAAWVVPEILTAKPAGGASLSGNPVTAPLSTSGAPASTPAAEPATAHSGLAFTGVDIQRDAEIGAALIAGGWAMHHWASRVPKPATETLTRARRAGSQDDPN